MEVLRHQTRGPLALLDTPPVWLIAAMALAWAQAHGLPLLPSRRVAVWVGLPPAVLPAVAGAVATVAVLLTIAAAFELKRHHTTLIARETPRRLVTGGLYSFSRNPIYLADLLLLTAAVLWLDLAALPLVPLLGVLLQRRFIAGEEARCAITFGADWQDYRGRVRRWLGRRARRKRA